MLSTAISYNASAQKADSIKHEYSGLCVSTIPQHIAIRTLKVDFDKQLGKSGNWLVLSTVFAYRDDDSDWNFSFNQWTTYGGGLHYRFYPFSKTEPKWFYMQPGFFLNYHQVKFNYQGWGRTLFNGAEAIRYRTLEGIDEIYQYGGNFKIGCMVKVNKSLFFDFYGGVSFIQSEVHSPDEHRNDHGDGLLGPAYKGVLPTWGVRVGMHL